MNKRYSSGLAALACASFFMACAARAETIAPLEADAAGLGGLAWSADQNYTAVKSVDGSYSWQDEPDPPDRSNLAADVPSEVSFLLTGGTGNATIYLPVSVTQMQSESDVYGPHRQLLSDQGHGAASLTFQSPGIDKSFFLNGTESLAPTSFVMALVVPYNVSFGLALDASLSVSTNPADNNVALCGTPGPSNPQCSLESAMSISTTFDAPYFEIPYGTTLMDNGLGGDFHYAVLNVPEPSDYVLLLGGLAMLGAAFTWRKHSGLTHSSATDGISALNPEN